MLGGLLYWVLAPYSIVEKKMGRDVELAGFVQKGS